MKSVYAIAICGILFACTKTTPETSRLYNADDDVLRAARDLNSSADRLESDASRLNSARQSVENEISRVGTAISNGRSFLTTVEGNIADADRSRAKAEDDRARYAADESRSNSEIVSLSAQMKKTMEDLSVLTQDNYILGNKVTLKKDQSAQLASFNERLRRVQGQTQSLFDLYDLTERLEKDAAVKHAGWMKTFNDLSTAYKPNFSGITDIQSYRAALSAINEFKSKIPSSAGNIEAELRLASEVNHFGEQKAALIASLQEFSRSKEMGVFVTLTGTADSGKKMDDMARTLTDITRVQQSQLKFNDNRSERRLYLTKVVPAAWEKLAKTYLQQNNVSLAIEIIKEADRALGDEYSYAALHTKLINSGNEYSSFYTAYLAPRKAIAIATDVKNFLVTVGSEERLALLSEPMRRQIVAELQDANRDWDGKLGMATADLGPEKSKALLKEWKRVTALLVKRQGDRMTSSCKAKADEIQNAVYADSHAEDAFVLLKKGGC